MIMTIFLDALLVKQGPQNDNCVYIKWYDDNCNKVKEIKMTFEEYRASRVCDFCSDYCNQGCAKFKK